MNPLKRIATSAAVSRRATRVSVAENGTPELTVLAEVNAVRIVYGRDARRLTSFELDGKLAARFAFTLLRWWILQTWCGLRSAILARATRKAFERASRAPRELRGGVKA